ncbi:Lrp/AsnC family transcriptional regulator [Rhodoblastus sp.]|jgi:DNA-binding Lrp family transcriptional regulator|uniref:siroheme decarboxylase subunit beta n=1 Tax=Rhodoblastus sp. TaxID=1962975 RepID=UPI002626DCEA|nr:Lrp/AsnC family transcriptional regulator [Rhodoblastus sp.]
MLDAHDKLLIDSFQRDFPLTSQPFALVGEIIGDSAEGALRRVARLIDAGVLSRLGVVLRPNSAGASTLAALKAPPRRLEEFAALVNEEPGVNHNYEREHELNLWFVVTGPSRESIDASLARIERRTGATVLDLPMLRAFHIDLGFPVFAREDHKKATARETAPPPPDASSLVLLAALDSGLPLCQKPYAEIASRLGWPEDQVIARLGDLVEAGTIKRLGLVVKHHALGFRANAMVVWDVADEALPDAARVLTEAASVTLCYERPRRAPVWRYNLFSMIHGRDRDIVRGEVAALAERIGGASRGHEILFSRRCFRQCGARLSAA